MDLSVSTLGQPPGLSEEALLDPVKLVGGGGGYGEGSGTLSWLCDHLAIGS